MKLNKLDIRKILSKYNVGDLVSYRPKKREGDFLQTCYLLKTSKGKFFLKRYTEFSYFKRKGLELVKYLLGKGYPCVRLYKTVGNRFYINYERSIFSLFEYLNPKERTYITAREAYELGRYLGRLHVLAKSFPINRATASYRDIVKEFKRNVGRKKDAPKKYRYVFGLIGDNLGKLNLLGKGPRSVCHQEFTPEHVKFRNGRVHRVIDWDLVGRDSMLYDLGTTCVASFQGNKLKFNILRNIIKDTTVKGN